jgi:homoserine kinase
MSIEHVTARGVSAMPGADAGSAPVARRVIVSVPASSANLGPGFDCLAVALDLRNRFTVTVPPFADQTPATVRMTVAGPVAGLEPLAQEADNLFVRAFQRVYAHLGEVPPPMILHMEVNLPPGRGLGSSATAVVGGLLAANVLRGAPLTSDVLLDLAAECEPGGHADNVAAALLGGLVVTGVRDARERLLAVRVPLPEGLRAVLFVPEQPMSTVQGRSLLPEAYARAEVSFNLGRVALVLAALQSGRLELLGEAMEDRLHQPYREQLFPALRPLIASARAAGAHGAALSGGGSSVLALVTAGAERVRAALERTAAELGVAGTGLIVGLSPDGALVEALDGDKLDDSKESDAGGDDELR